MGTFREGIITYFISKVRRPIVYLKIQHYAQLRSTNIDKHHNNKQKAPENRSSCFL